MHFQRNINIPVVRTSQLNLKLDNQEDHLAFKIIPRRTPPPLSVSLCLQSSVALRCHPLPSLDVTFDLFLLPLLNTGKHAMLCCREDAAYAGIYNACVIACDLMSSSSTALLKMY